MRPSKDVSTILSSQLDANPSLYIYDLIFATDAHLAKSLSGKTIWITGASSGIGAAMARQLSYHGANLILSSRDERKLNRVLSDCRREITKRRERTTSSNNDVCYPNEVTTLPLDVTANDKTLEKSIDAALRRFESSSSSGGGGIDILVLNAGRGQLSPSLLTPMETTRQSMEINFFSPVRMALGVMKHKQHGWMTNRERTNDSSNGIDRTTTRPSKTKGHIVVTSSVGAKMALPLGGSYAGSKRALHGYFETLRSEYNSHLRVDLCCPGPVATDIGRAAFRAREGEEERGEAATMTAERCARLMISGMVGPEWWFRESWMAKQPVLGFMFLGQYFPMMTGGLLTVLGGVRVKAWEEGLPLYKMSSWIKSFQSSVSSSSSRSDGDGKDEEDD